MIRCFYVLLLCSLVGAQPLSCDEDAHCSEYYYCEVQAHVCYQCLQCEELNRFEPESVDTLCIKSVNACGPCFEGFVNIYDDEMKGKCVPPELLNFERHSYCVYIWVTAAGTGLLIVVVFIHVLWNTNVFRIVPLYDPVTPKPPISGEPAADVVVRKNLFKKILHFFKNIN